MSESSKKGPLIKKKTRTNMLERPKPVVINSKNEFKFNSAPSDSNQTIGNALMPKDKNFASLPAEKKPSIPVSETKIQQPRKTKSVVGKNNNVKSIKVPHDLHIQIGVLGKFMDENKTYAILSELVAYYTKNELTDRQQKQFEYMTEFFNETDE